MKLRLHLTLLYTGLACLAGNAKDPTDDVELDGSLKVGIGYYDNGYLGQDPPIYSDDMIYTVRGQIDLTVDITDRLQASMDFRGDLDDFGVQIQKAYLEIETSENSRFRFGNMKKEFSLEEMDSRHDIKTINRSLLHRHLDSFHLMSYDITAHYQRERETVGGERTYTLNLGVNPRILAFLNTFAEFDYEWGAFVLGNITAAEMQPFLAFTVFEVGYEAPWEGFYLVTELFAGNDPNAAIVVRNLGDPRTVWMTGIRLLGSKPFALGDGLVKRLEPVVGTSFLLPDLEDQYQSTLELTPGFIVFFTESNDAQWKSTLELVFTRDRYHTEFGRQSYEINSQIQVEW